MRAHRLPEPPTSCLLPEKVRVGFSGRGGVEHLSLELLKHCWGDLTYLTHLVGEVVRKEIWSLNNRICWFDPTLVLVAQTYPSLGLCQSVIILDCAACCLQFTYTVRNSRIPTSLLLIMRISTWFFPLSPWMSQMMSKWKLFAVHS